MMVKVKLGALGASALVMCGVVFGSCKVPDKPAPPIAPPVVKSFTVSKDRVNKGEAVQFTFSTDRARTVTLTDQAGTDVATTFDAAAGTGTASASPTASSFYVLHAEGDGGRDTAFVQVAVNEDLKSVFLVVVPTVVNAGQSVDILWSAPGGTGVTVTAGTTQIGTGDKGTKTDVPARSTTYTLSATRLDNTKVTSSVAVKVVPVIQSLTVDPAAAQPGKTLTVSWKTAGAEKVVLSEATFGQLTESTTDVDTGTYAFEVPAYFGDAGVPDPDAGVTDGGASAVPPVRDGFPLKFTLVASTTTPAQSVSRAAAARVGDGPVIDAFDAPTAATLNKPQLLSWQTTNAVRVELLADGQPLFSPRPNTSVDGSFTLPAINAETTFTLVAYDFTGLSVSASRTVKPVKSPTIVSFTLPTSVSTSASAIAAAWQTRDASNVTIRVKNGFAVHYTDLAAQVSNGSTSLLAGVDTTFVLEARNAAGEVVTQEKRVTITAPLTFSITPSPSAAGTVVTAAWDVSSTGALSLPGMPNGSPTASQNTAMNFLDLDTTPQAQQLFFADRNNGSATFSAPAGFVFPFVTTYANSFTVSVNGAFALGNGALGAANTDLAATTWAGPVTIAPFWDDLDLGAEGSVKWYLDGNDFPRTLIIQWSKVQISGQTGTELTFQVQLEETGRFLFSYQTMTGPNADGASASIGVIESNGTFQASRSFNAAAAVAAGDELEWFGNDATRAVSTQPLKLNTSASFGFFAKTGAGDLIPVFGTARVYAPNSVLVNEAMPVSVATLTEARWVELYNPGAATIDLSDLEVFSSTAMTAFTIPAGTSIDAGAYLVVGDSSDSAANGGAPVSLAWGSSLPLGVADQVALRVGGSTPFNLSSLSWVAGPADAGITASTPGFSVQSPEPAITTTGAPLTCTHAVTYGSAAQVGTPGAANETCFEYSLTRIPVAFEDVSSGTAVFPPGFNDQIFATITLPTPFKYFGADKTSAAVSSNGWVSFSPQTSNYSSNRTAPSTTSQPVGALAVFWDDLASSNTTFPNANVYWARVGDHVTIMWLHSTFWLPASDDMNFEVKLFDSGVIEYHYGTMTNNPGSTTTRYAEGGSATVWIERPTGTAALAIIRNTSASTATGFIAPNTAYRFTPKN